MSRGVSLSETELETLVVRLVGDGSEYQKMLKDAQEQTKLAAQAVAEQSKAIESFSNKAGAFAQNIAAAFASAGILEWLKEAKHEWQAAELVAIQLNAVLESNGRDAKLVGKDYAEFATEMEKVTIVADDTTLSMLKQAESFEITGDAAKKAVKDAIALGAMNDSTGESYLRMTAAMAKGDVEQAKMFARMVPQLRHTKDEFEFADKYNKLIASGTRTAEQVAKSGSGRAKQFANTYNNLQEDFGRIFSEVINPMKIAKKEAVAFASSLVEEDKRALVYTLALTAGLLAIGPIVKGLYVYGQVAASGFKLLTTSYGGAAFGAVALGAGMIALGKIIYENDSRTQALNKSIEAGIKLSEELQSVTSKSVEFKITQIKAMPEGEGKQATIAEETRKAQQEIDALNTRLAKEQKELEGLSHWWQLVADPDSKLKQDQVNNTNKLLEIQKGKYRELQNLKNSSGNPSGDRALAKDILELNKKMEEQIELYGKSSEAAEIAKLKKRGATEVQLMYANQVAQQIEDAKKVDAAFEEEWQAQDKLNESVSEAIETLKDEVAMFDQSAAAIQLYKLEKDGASEADLAQIARLQKTKQKLEEHNKVLEAGKLLMEEFASPQEKFTARQLELQKMLDENAITSDVYNKAMKAAKEQMDDATKAAQGTRAAVQQLDSAMRGSAESRQRIADYLDRNRSGPGLRSGIKPVAPVNAPAGGSPAYYAGYAAQGRPKTEWENKTVAPILAGILVATQEMADNDSTDWAVPGNMWASGR